MDPSQKKFLIDKMKELTARDFDAVLRYYSIPVKRRSILCLWHDDRNYGSCYLTKDGRKAFCYACQRPIDAVDVVMREEGLDHVDAAERIWVDILGNPMPPGEEDDGRAPVATAKELSFIGLSGAGGGTAERFVNACPRCDSEFGADQSEKAWRGAVVVKDSSTRHPPLLKLLETDPEVGAAIIEGKAEETVRYYERLERDLVRKNSEFGKLLRGRSPEDVAEIRETIVKDLRKAKAIRKKIRNR